MPTSLNKKSACSCNDGRHLSDVRCMLCDREGYPKDRCWQTYPHLKKSPQELEAARNKPKVEFTKNEITSGLPLSSSRKWATDELLIDHIRDEKFQIRCLHNENLPSKDCNSLCLVFGLLRLLDGACTQSFKGFKYTESTRLSRMS